MGVRRNGEGLEFRFGTYALKIATKHLASTLLVVALGGVIYLLCYQLSEKNYQEHTRLNNELENIRESVDRHTRMMTFLLMPEEQRKQLSLLGHLQKELRDILESERKGY